MGLAWVRRLGLISSEVGLLKSCIALLDTLDWRLYWMIALILIAR